MTSLHVHAIHSYSPFKINYVTVIIFNKTFRPWFSSKWICILHSVLVQHYHVKYKHCETTFWVTSIWCNQRYIKNTIGVICMFIPCGIFHMPGNISNIVEYNFPLTLRNLIKCVRSLNAKHNITIYSKLGYVCRHPTVPQNVHYMHALLTSTYSLRFLHPIRA